METTWTNRYIYLCVCALKNIQLKCALAMSKHVVPLWPDTHQLL